MPRELSSSCIFLSISGAALVAGAPLPVSTTFTSSESPPIERITPTAELFIKMVAVLHGVDTGLGHRSLQIFDPLVIEAHEFSDACRRIHRYLLIAKLGRNA